MCNEHNIEVVELRREPVVPDGVWGGEEDRNMVFVYGDCSGGGGHRAKEKLYR